MVSSIPSHLFSASTTSLAVRLGRPAVSVESIGSLLCRSPSPPTISRSATIPPWCERKTDCSLRSRSRFVLLSWAISLSVLSFRSWYIFSLKLSSLRRSLEFKVIQHRVNNTELSIAGISGGGNQTRSSTLALFSMYSLEILSRGHQSQGWEISALPGPSLNL